jgi:hypothetical protein
VEVGDESIADMAKWKFLEFIKTAGILGGGSVTLAIISFGITALEHAKDHNVATAVFGFLTIVFFCVGAYTAWDKERDKRIEVENKYESERPRLMLVVNTHISGKQWRELTHSGKTSVFFSIQHLDGRPATDVSIDPIQSEKGNFTLKFGELPYVMDKTRSNVSFEVWENGIAPDPKTIESIGWDCMLPIFFNTSDLDVRMHDYDAIVRYKDRDEDRSQQFRITFDAKEQKLLPTKEITLPSITQKPISQNLQQAFPAP